MPSLVSEKSVEAEAAEEIINSAGSSPFLASFLVGFSADEDSCLFLMLAWVASHDGSQVCSIFDGFDGRQKLVFDELLG